MTPLDHTTFRSNEVDALYDELDAATTAAMDDHAASCAACAARFERLRARRRVVVPAITEAVPSGLEARIMAAVDAALATPKRPPKAKAEGGARIVQFVSRPSFLVAATFVLLLGGGAVLNVEWRTRPMSSPSMANAPAPPLPEEAPAAAASKALLGSAVEQRDLGDHSSPRATVALQVPAVPGPSFKADPAAAEPPAKPRSLSKAGLSEEDVAFMSAKSLYDSGRYAEALPRFDALKTTPPEAELYAARCVAKTRGCAAAVPRFDNVAKSNVGSETGSRATLEGAQCYESLGDAQGARARYEALQRDGLLEEEARRKLEGLDRAASSKAAATAGTPGAGGRPATPKAPVPVAPPADPALRR